jgi:short-subunit dehydrogenase
MASRKLALVTGASAGIGKELARYHVKQGGDVIVAARRKEKLEELKTELEKEGAKVYVMTSDLSKLEGAQQLYDEIKKQKLEGE